MYCFVPFDPGNEHQRSGLALSGGFVYIVWASHEDHSPYHGWVIGFDATTLQQITNYTFASTPNATRRVPIRKCARLAASSAV